MLAVRDIGSTNPPPVPAHSHESVSAGWNFGPWCCLNLIWNCCSGRTRCSHADPAAGVVVAFAAAASAVPAGCGKRNSGQHSALSVANRRYSACVVQLYFDIDNHPIAAAHRDCS